NILLSITTIRKSSSTSTMSLVLGDRNIIVKPADDTTILGLIKGRDESSYRDLVSQITVYEEGKKTLFFNIDKTRELKESPPLQTLTSKGTEGEQLDSYLYRGLHIVENLNWAKTMTPQRKRAHQLPKRAGPKCQLLMQAYRGLVESIVTSGIIVWLGNTTQAEGQSF
ncbi:putative RNA-directed DNA polymerase from transposon BS, partial [Xyrichtys novacula]